MSESITLKKLLKSIGTNLNGESAYEIYDIVDAILRYENDIDSNHPVLRNLKQQLLDLGYAPPKRDL